jgi:1-acyl-sn-glycerol-3-phosphate acyltransferase
MRTWGVENVPERGGVLLAANHQSFLDPPAVGLALRRQVYYVARASLFRVPLLGWFLRKQHGVPIERDAADLSAIRMAIDLLRRGEGLVLFPEGTRTSDGSVGEFRPGFAIVAARARAPIVPVAIDGAFEAWPRGQRLPRSGRVRVAYGQPVEPLGSGKEACVATAREVHRRVVALLDGLRQRE